MSFIRFTTRELSNTFGKRFLTTRPAAVFQLPAGKEKAAPQNVKVQGADVKRMTEAEKEQELRRALDFPWQTSPTTNTSASNLGAPERPKIGYGGYGKK